MRVSVNYDTFFPSYCWGDVVQHEKAIEQSQRQGHLVPPTEPWMPRQAVTRHILGMCGDQIGQISDIGDRHGKLKRSVSSRILARFSLVVCRYATDSYYDEIPTSNFIGIYESPVIFEDMENQIFKFLLKITLKNIQLQGYISKYCEVLVLCQMPGLLWLCLWH